jgi:hypothetical protein
VIPAECAPRGSNPRRHGLRIHRSTAELEAPGTGGESRTLKGVSPPGSEPSASSISATPAWWTQPGSNRHVSRCKRGALPLVRWAQGPGGSNRTTAGKMPRGLRPRSSSQQRSPGRDRSVSPSPIGAVPIPNLAYYLVVNVRCLIADLGKKGKASPSRGGRSRTHVRRVGAGCPFRWTTPLRVCGYAVVRLVREYKRAAPFRKRLLNELDVYVLVMPLRAPPGGRSSPNRTIARPIAGP